MLSFLSDDGPDGLRWDVHVDRLLLWSLDAQTPSTGAEVHTAGTTVTFTIFFFFFARMKGKKSSDANQEVTYPKATVGGRRGGVSGRRWRHVGGGGEETQSAQVESRHQVSLLLRGGRRKQEAE